MDTPANNKYAPPKSVVADVETPAGELGNASRSSRLGAAMIDGLIFSTPFIPSYVKALPALLHGPGRPTALSVWPALAATGGWFYFGLLAAVCTCSITALLVYRNGQTIGKKLVGVKVVRKDGSRATLARIFWVRYLLNTVFSLIPVLGSFYGLIDALFIFGAAHRCCHDYLADTIVIRA